MDGDASGVNKALALAIGWSYSDIHEVWSCICKEGYRVWYDKLPINYADIPIQNDKLWN
jgi:hypothetical protein